MKINLIILMISLILINSVIGATIQPNIEKMESMDEDEFGTMVMLNSDGTYSETDFSSLIKTMESMDEDEIVIMDSNGITTMTQDQFKSYLSTTSSFIPLTNSWSTSSITKKNIKSSITTIQQNLGSGEFLILSPAVADMYSTSTTKFKAGENEDNNYLVWILGILGILIILGIGLYLKFKPKKRSKKK